MKCKYCKGTGKQDSINHYWNCIKVECEFCYGSKKLSIFERIMYLYDEIEEIYNRWAYYRKSKSKTLKDLECNDKRERLTEYPIDGNGVG